MSCLLLWQFYSVWCLAMCIVNTIAENSSKVDNGNYNCGHTIMIHGLRER